MMVFFDIDGTLLDHKNAEFTGVKLFYQNYRNFLVWILMNFILCGANYQKKNFEKIFSQRMLF